MRSVTLLLAVVFAVPAAVSSQSLGEVAKKEKERRKAIKGESKVIDDVALRRAEGDSLSVTGTAVDESEPAVPSSSSSTSTSTTTSSSSSSSSSRADRDRDRPSPAELRERRKARAEALEAARARVEQARESVKNCKQGARRPSSFGDVDCSVVEQSLRRAQENLRRTQSSRP